MNKISIYVLLLTVATSCISHKELTYFQGQPATKTSLYKLNNQPYKLQVNDVLSIDIKAEDEKLVALFKISSDALNKKDLYFDGYTIDRDGNIRLPYIGEMNVLGYTLKEVREKIQTELKKYIKNTDSVFVKVKLAGIRFVVTGEVNSPGTIVLLQNQVSIIEAIANAGDITDTGDRKNISLLRKTIDGVEKHTLDLTNVTVFNSPYFYVQPNDVIYVSPLKQKSWGTGSTGLQTFTTLVTILSFVASTVLLVKNL